MARLEPLIKEMGDRVIVMHYGPAEGRRKLLTLEHAGISRTPDSTIRALCRIIESLSPECRSIWDRSRTVFDIGCELRPSERSSQFALEPATVSRVAALGATIGVTYYHGENG